MHLLIIALALGIFLHDALMSDAAPRVGPGALLLIFIVPKVVLAGLYALSCRHVLSRLSSRRGQSLVCRLDRGSALYRLLLLGLYGLDLFIGVLSVIRRYVGDVVLLDELLLLLPTLAMLTWAWWVYYPIDRRLREASLIAQIDSGRPVYPPWSRGQFLLAQMRHQVLLILAPLLLIMGWGELVQQYGPSQWTLLGADVRPILVGIGAMAVFLLAPVMLRHLWDTTPLPPGEIRDTLVALCARHGVYVRELLLWRTFGGMINAAVMGLIAPLRYILLTDALLDMLRRDEVEAVMAHELGHVRRHHMFWLLAAAAGLLGVFELAVHGALWLAAEVRAETGAAALGTWEADLLTSPHVVLGTAGAAAITGWIAAFGWVSRRFERQADAFAVQSLAAHRSGVQSGGDDGGGVVIDRHSTNTMISALQQVAQLNHIPPRRRSWRHGSIAWRQAYLRSLVGRRADDLPIDRQMRWIKLGAAAAVVLVVAGNLAM